MSVLLLGNYRPTIALVRALGRAGQQGIVGLGGGEGGAEHSPYASEGWGHPPVEGRRDAFLSSCCAALGYPVVLRPLDSTRRLAARRAIMVAGPDQLARSVPLWPAGQPGLLVQRQVTGLRHNVYFATRSGGIVRIVEA